MLISSTIFVNILQNIATLFRNVGKKFNPSSTGSGGSQQRRPARQRAGPAARRVEPSEQA
jgi:hypothetical protein